MRFDFGAAALLAEQALTRDSSTPDVPDVPDPALVWLQAAEDGDSACTTAMLEDEAFTAVNARFTEINMGLGWQKNFVGVFLFAW